MPLAPYQKLIDYWSDPEARMRFGASDEEAVSSLERRYGVQFPPEFRTYLLNVSTEDDNLDQNCTEWWSLSRIKNIPEEYESTIANAEITKDARSYLFFADYMFWCMAWAICCQPGDNFGRVVVISGSEDRFVADSFGDFIDSYIRDHRDLI